MEPLYLYSDGISCIDAHSRFLRYISRLNMSLTMNTVDGEAQVKSFGTTHQNEASRTFSGFPSTKFRLLVDKYKSSGVYSYPLRRFSSVGRAKD